MCRIPSVILSAVVPLLAVGCIQTKQDYTLNPDGSGKVVLDAIFTDLVDGGHIDPETQMKNTVNEVLGESKGVDAWKDISYRRTDDGRILLKATAYFRDLSNLKFYLHRGGVNAQLMRPMLRKDGGGKLLLELDTPAEDRAKFRAETAKRLSEEEIAKRVQRKKVEYRPARGEFRKHP